MTVAEAARQLEVKTSLVYALCADGSLGHMRIGRSRGTIRITQADLDAYVASVRVDPKGRSPKPYAPGTGMAIRSIIGEAIAKEQGREKGRPGGRRRASGRSDA